MSQAGQQAAGAAVGAAVGAVAGGPVGAVMGAQIGGATVAAGQSYFAGQEQGMLDDAALKMNMAQARLNAAEKSAVLARNFRKSLASQVAVAAMRGGTGSLVAQFGIEDYQNYMQDQKAIESGLKIAETQGAIGEAQNKADANTRDIKVFKDFTSSVGDAVNFSNLLKGKGK